MGRASLFPAAIKTEPHSSHLRFSWARGAASKSGRASSQQPRTSDQIASPCASQPSRSFHITGNYSFGSGLEHADWAGSGSVTQPEEGNPDYIFAVVPKAEAEVIGNWDVMGLRSTASYDYKIDSDVPADRTFSMFGFTRHRGGKQFDPLRQSWRYIDVKKEKP